jgi:RNA polymerase sigma-70 factor, ECF subfamily
MSGVHDPRMPDFAAFEEIYKEHFAFVWRSLRRLGVPESDVSDAAQDVFLVVHRRLDEFEGRSKMTTWLYGICLRVARDRKRLAHNRRRSDDDSPLDEAVDENVDVAGEAERRQGIRLLQALLDMLSEDQREVFAMYELEGYGGEFIADQLKIPIGTVHSRLRLAREAFERNLKRLQARDRFRLPGAGGEP